MFIESTPNEQMLDDELSRPDEQTIAAVQSLDGDVVVLGAGGKMGPTLARMVRRAIDAGDDTRTKSRRVYAVSRFSDERAAGALTAQGIDVVRADLADPRQFAALPDAPNVLWMVGQKFGTSDDPVPTWTNNVLASSYAAERYAGSRIVCFSTGNVYGRSSASLSGSRETDALVPDGEYAASCIGRERVFESMARRTNSPLLLFRLFYACDLRYGVLTDLAAKVWDGQLISLSTPLVNVIWQGDANRLAVRALSIAGTPPVALNVTGPIVPVRMLAERLGELLHRDPNFDSDTGTDALIANTDALHRMLPHEPLPLETLIEWTAKWIHGGGRLLSKPTKFDVRDGKF